MFVDVNFLNFALRFRFASSRIGQAPRHASPAERARRAQEVVDSRPARPMMPTGHNSFRGFVSGANASNVQTNAFGTNTLGLGNNFRPNGAQVPLPRPTDEDI